jgi:hypothetical protein
MRALEARERIEEDLRLPVVTSHDTAGESVLQPRSGKA